MYLKFSQSILTTARLEFYSSLFGTLVNCDQRTIDICKYGVSRIARSSADKPETDDRRRAGDEPDQAESQNNVPQKATGKSHVYFVLGL